MVVGVHRDAGVEDPAHPLDTHLRDATLTDEVMGQAELDVLRSE